MNKKRKAIWDKSGGRCWYCGCQLPEKGWHADHFFPVVRDFNFVFDEKKAANVARSNGECKNPELDCEENKVPACASCNIIKSSNSIEGFRMVIEGFIRSLNRDSTQYKFAKRYGLVEEKEINVKFWFEENETDKQKAIPNNR